MIVYSEQDFLNDAVSLSNIIDKNKYTSIYPVPRGGIALGVILAQMLSLPIVTKNNIDAKTLVVDDLVDSGATRQKFAENDFACIHIKSHTPSNMLPTYYLHKTREWIKYWWEDDISTINDNIMRILQYIGEDPTREGLLETPKRVIKAYDHIFSGYKQNPKDMIKVFSETNNNEMILLRNIEIYSMCEHHMLPFIGKAHIAYIPNNRVIGISKLARIADVFARRLQIQERLCDQITECLMNELQPLGAACVIEAQHLCMQMRGVEKQNSIMITSSLKGVFIEKPETREEFMRLIK
jgi:GTP cyclohydrolase I